ncbi:MAG: thiamine-phosphate kinase, partial [Desulfobulbaceae bacterium]|nr:thiamine-phosphate kinase [Desulfobulbaceae bacterium]
MRERDLIKSIAAMVGPASGNLLLGIGDDCAVIQKSSDRVWLVTMDTLVETVHFDCRWHGPEKIGRKAVSVNVSDIAAMGGTPVFVLLSLGLPSGFDKKWFFTFSKGLTSACRNYGCQLIGGDTVRSPDRINISVTVIGEANLRQVLYRHGGKA